MKQVSLTQGRFSLVDDADYEWLSKYNWCFDRYATRGTRKGGKYKVISMQNVIMLPPKGMLVDHIDGNTLNNQRSNLRICTPKENGQNKNKPKSNTSGYKGVTIEKGRYRTRIKTDGKLISLGVFDNIIDAAMAYNKAALNLFGSFARLNLV